MISRHPLCRVVLRRIAPLIIILGLLAEQRPPAMTASAAGVCSAAVLVAPLLAASSRQRTAVLWSHLDMLVRQRWIDQAELMAFMGAKFGGLPPLRLARIVTGHGESRVYLRLTRPTTLVNPTDLHLLLALPLHVQATSRSCSISDLGPFDPDAPVLRRLLPHTRRGAIPILMYHYISAQPALTALQYGLTVTDADFAAQLAYLSSHGYHTILLPRLLAYLQDGVPLPPHPLVLTFDDGYRDNYTDAFPLLRRYHMVGEFGIITAFVGQQVGINTYMDWSQLTRLQHAGMEIESHSVDHQDLRYVSAGVMVNEVRYAQATLHRQLGVAAQFFTYPSGEPFRTGTAAQQNAIIAYLQQYGVAGALLDPVTPSVQQDGAKPYQLQRVRVSGGETMATFVVRLQGASS